MYLEVRVNSLELLSVVRQLGTDVMAVCEDTVKVSPVPLDRHPGCDDQISQHQLPLPSTNFCLEKFHVLAHQDVLQLQLQRKQKNTMMVIRKQKSLK